MDYVICEVLLFVCERKMFLFKELSHAVQVAKSIGKATSNEVVVN